MRSEVPNTMNERKPKTKSSQNKGSGTRGNNSGKNRGSKKRGKGRSRGGRSKKIDLAKYWGDSTALPTHDDPVVPAGDPGAAVNSLGRPPIPGHENASVHYFNLVYDRAANLAVALAAAGGLNDLATNGQSDTRTTTRSPTTPGAP